MAGSAGTGMALEIGSVGGTGSGKAARTPVVAARSAAGPDGAGAAAAVAGAGAGLAALPTIVETFLEMYAFDRAVRAAPLPGSWTRYQSPCTACSCSTVPAGTRARIELF
jgi:hypothetical protein